MRRVGVVGWVLLFGVAVALGGSAGAIAAPDYGPDNPPLNLSSIDEPVLVFDVELEENGDARWTVRAKFPIDTPDGQAAYDDLAAEFEADGGEAALSIRPYQAITDEIESALDRSMTITDVDRSTGEQGDVGTLALQFTWEGFAPADEERVYHGDVYGATEQPWFTALQEQEFLRVHGPENYTIEQSAAPVSERVMWLAGPMELTPAALSTTFVDPAAYQESPPPVDEPPEPTGIATSVLLLIFSIFVLMVAVAIAVVDRRPDELISDAMASMPAIPGIPIREENGQDPHSVAEPEPEPVDPTLLSDEERVLYLLNERDGRMKQGEIVTETDWSNAKVSQLLSALADEGRVEKLRIGRENLIRLPDREADDT